MFNLSSILSLDRKFKKLISSKRLLNNTFKVSTCVQTEINFCAALGEGDFRAGAVRRRPPGHVTRLTYSTDQLFSLKGLSHENKLDWNWYGQIRLCFVITALQFWKVWKIYLTAKHNLKFCYNSHGSQNTFFVQERERGHRKRFARCFGLFL